MISKSMCWNAESNAAPFLLKPIGKDYLWGGTRLNDDFSKEIMLEPLAETWECSTHPDGLSIIGSGVHQGRLLSEVLQEYPEYIGFRQESIGDLPILVKLIDAKENLSVQVHPNDQYARVHENGQRGKSEMWYVLEASKEATLVYGLRHELSPEILKSSIDDGTLGWYLQKVKIKKGDIFYVPAGMVHAIGAGALVAEIQENSNLTYRLYDYNRIDKHGRKRELHIEKALEVANLQGSAVPVQPMRILQYRQGCASEVLCRCPYFEVRRLLVNTERCRQMMCYQTDGLSFHVLVCISGCGILRAEGSDTIPVFKGDSIFFPANSRPSYLHGVMEFLDVRC